MKGKINLKSNKNIFLSVLLVFALILSPVTSLFKYIGRVFASSPAINDVNGETLCLKNFNNSVKFKQFYILPGFRFGNIDKNFTYADRNSDELGGWNVQYLITSPIGKTVEPEFVDGAYGFYANMKGIYKLTVKTVKDGVISTEIKNLRIDVVDAEVSISYPANSEYVLPNKVPAGASVFLPIADVNNPDNIDLTGYTTEVKVKSKNENFEDVSALTLDASGKFYKYTPASDAANGIYEVRYQYKKGENVVSTISKTFEYTSDSEFIDNMKLEFTLNSSMIQTAKAGISSTLPSAKIVDANANSEEQINAHLKIVVKYHDTTNDSYVDVTDEVLNGFTFTPTRIGNYYVTYQAVIPYSQMKTGLKDVTSGEPKSYVIRDVADNEDPTILFTKSYKLSEDKSSIIEINGEAVSADQDFEETLEALGDETNAIPSIVVMDKEIEVNSEKKYVAEFELPAMFAKDNFSKNFSDYEIISRQIKGGSFTGYVDITDGEKTYAANETAKFVANKAGTYYVKYTVKDKSGNETYKTYTIKVISKTTFTEDYSEIKPEITMSELPTSIRSNDVLDFTFSASDKYDERLNNKVEITATASTGTFDNSTATKVVESSSKYFTINGTKYSFNFAQFLADNQPSGEGELIISDLKVKAISVNDYNTANPAEVVKSISVINTKDSTPVTISLFDSEHSFNYQLKELNKLGESLEADGLSSADKALFVQKQTIKLPDFKFVEIGSASVKFDVTVNDKKGNSIPVAYEFVKDTEYTGAGHQFILKNTSFVASYSGLYTITYNITDAGNNITSKTFAVQVNDTERPSIIIVDETNLNTTIELGTTVKIPVAGLLDDGTKVDLDSTNASTNVSISSNGSQYFDYATYTFKPEKTGEYVIKYTGKDVAGNDAIPVEYTITVKDSVSPVITLNSEVDLTKAWSDDVAVEVDVPFATVSDLNLDLNNESQTYAQITVTNAKGTKQTLLEREDGNKYFVAEAQGVYTITYTATDADKNTTTLTRTVAVGNCYQPTLQFINNYSVPKTLKVGQSFTLSLDDEFVLITDKDGSDEQITKTVTLTDPDGKTVENSTNSWSFSKAGDYKLKISLSDGQTEAKVYTYTITVEDKEISESSKINASVGTILIVVSILALGAVVVYFVVTNKKGSAKKLKKSSKNNK